jgi:hypothetical protein
MLPSISGQTQKKNTFGEEKMIWSVVSQIEKRERKEWSFSGNKKRMVQATISKSPRRKSFKVFVYFLQKEKKIYQKKRKIANHWSVKISVIKIIKHPRRKNILFLLFNHWNKNGIKSRITPLK